MKLFFVGEGGRFFWRRFWEKTKTKKGKKKNEFVNNTIKRIEFT